MNPDSIRLVKTCNGCPEQYDAYSGSRKVGYLRLRYGQFTVRVPSHEGMVVMSANAKGDGEFEDDERENYLSMAKQMIAARHTLEEVETILEILKAANASGGAIKPTPEAKA